MQLMHPLTVSFRLYYCVLRLQCSVPRDTEHLYFVLQKPLKDTSR